MNKVVQRVDISATDLDVFKQVLGTVEDILNDERIDIVLREEYNNRLKKALKQQRNVALK